jgi:hypothetical protein
MASNHHVCLKDVSAAIRVCWQSNCLQLPTAAHWPLTARSCIMQPMQG